jgi:hypothetical protein
MQPLDEMPAVGFAGLGIRALHRYGYDQIETNTGIRFAKAFPITNTSHVSILTGLLPSNHDVTDLLAIRQQPTLAELPRQNYTALRRLNRF